jgi:hypothetical protein
VIHRHLEYPADVEVDELPSAAIVDVLERGDLDHWRPIARAAARDPHGPLASRVLDLVSAHPMYGTSPLWRAWIDRCRARTEPALSPGGPLSLAALRRTMGVTQTELGEQIGMSQSDLSKLERRKDVRVSSLRAFAGGLGGALRIVFERGSLRRPIDVGQG